MTLVEVVGGVVEIDMRSGDCINLYIYFFTAFFQQQLLFSTFSTFSERGMWVG